jgi:CHAT domain-containing protein
VLNNIGLVRHARRDYAGARQALEDALAIEERTLGDRHPALPQTLINVGVSRWAQGRTTEALAAFARAHEVRERGFDALIATGSERQRVAAVHRVAGELDTLVSFHTQALPDDPRAGQLACEAVLARKGRVLDALADTVEALRRHLSEADRELLDRLSALRGRIAALAAGEPATGERGDSDRVRALLAEEERLQRELSERSAEYQAETERVDLRRVQARIPADCALVDILLYRLIDPRVPPGAAPAAERYVAYVVRAEGEPAWVDLGDATLADELVSAFRAAVADPARDDVGRHARALDEHVMRRLRPRLGGTRHVLLCPDGAFNLVPFGALQDEQGRYRIEDCSFTYLTAGRDLIRRDRRRTSRGAPVVVAGVNYAARGHDDSRRQWAPLPHTLGEADAVVEVFPDARVLEADAATDTALRALAGPRLLHVATHGYFEAAPGHGPGAANPLLRSGLILAGANGPPAGNDDGVLSALEVAGLDLWGTRLVVLSACETGLGELQHREGVYGLRRALVLAGAESQVISLWQVSSVATRALMRAYYEQLRDRRGRTDALHAVQRTMLAGRYAHPYYWAAFIPSGDWEPLPGPETVRDEV